MKLEQCDTFSSLNVLPSGSSRGGISKLWWAMVKASWMLSLGSLDKLSVRSTKSGLMDLITAKNASPLFQLIPKSNTSTPNLQRWQKNKSTVGPRSSWSVWMLHSHRLLFSIWISFRLTWMCIFVPTAAESWLFSRGRLAPWQPLCLRLAECCKSSCQCRLAGA